MKGRRRRGDIGEMMCLRRGVSWNRRAICGWPLMKVRTEAEIVHNDYFMMGMREMMTIV